jgi:2-oxoacid dehydrogenases acyltransferase (catalytic domain)
VPALARAIDDLGSRARGDKPRGEDVAGGTFTLSNPGPFGARMTLPIINQPQVAIVTVDAIAPLNSCATCTRSLRSRTRRSSSPTCSRGNISGREHVGEQYFASRGGWS